MKCDLKNIIISITINWHKNVWNAKKSEKNVSNFMVVIVKLTASFMYEQSD